jgi:hypothetical protein
MKSIKWTPKLARSLREVHQIGSVLMRDGEQPDRVARATKSGIDPPKIAMPTRSCHTSLSALLLVHLLRLAHRIIVFTCNGGPAHITACVSNG